MDIQDKELARTIARVNRYAWWLDRSIRVPFLNYRIGVDSVVGLIPGIGDSLGALASMYIILMAARIGIPVRVLLRMGGNVALDALLGSVPLLGDLFDMGFKANVRNARLLMRHIEGRTSAPPSSQDRTRSSVQQAS
jgi:hypothetical protein